MRYESQHGTNPLGMNLRMWFAGCFDCALGAELVVWRVGVRKLTPTYVGGLNHQGLVFIKDD